MASSAGGHGSGGSIVRQKNFGLSPGGIYSQHLTKATVVCAIADRSIVSIMADVSADLTAVFEFSSSGLIKRHVAAKFTVLGNCRAPPSDLGSKMPMTAPVGL